MPDVTRDRRAAIVELVRTHHVGTQAELGELLGKRGYEVTQATLSRDLAKLRARRVSLPDGGTAYELEGFTARTGVEPAQLAAVDQHLHARFGRPAAKVGKKTCVVIFDAMREGERVELGLMVDAVSEVVDIAADAIEPPPNFGTSVRRDFIRAMGKRGDRFVIILEPDRAFDVDEMASLCEASQEALAA